MRNASMACVFVPMMCRMRRERLKAEFARSNRIGSALVLDAPQLPVYEHLHERAIRPNWIIGASIGAVTGAILAGNAPEQRIEKLTRLWEEATLPTFPMIAARPSSKSTAAKRSGLQLYFNAGCPLPRA